MTQSMNDFDDRLRRIDSQRRRAGQTRALSRGLSQGQGRTMRFEVDDYGNVRRLKTRRLPLWRLLRLLSFLVLGLYLFKVAAFATLGESRFLLRSVELAEGSAWERGIASLMQPDPLTESLAAQLRPLLKSR